MFPIRCAPIFQPFGEIKTSAISKAMQSVFEHSWDPEECKQGLSKEESWLIPCKTERNERI